MKLPFFLRRAAERLSRGRVLTRCLPVEFGKLQIRVSPGASLRYWLSIKSTDYCDLFDFAGHFVLPGMTIWDVGSNVGLFAFSAAARAGPQGRVLCLEPDPWSVGLLRESARLNSGRAATPDILPVAVGRRLGIEWLHIPERSRAAAHLASTSGGAGAEITGTVRERFLVPLVTLDHLAAHYPPPAVLKIDVDGAEADVLAGGRLLFERHRPVLLIEVHERNADTITEQLHDWGYSLFDYNCGEAGRAPVDRASYNTLALPPSQIPHRAGDPGPS